MYGLCKKRKNTKDYKKKLVKDIKIFQKIKKKKRGDVVVNVTKISQKMKNKSLLSIEKILQNEKKRIIIKSHDLKIYFKKLI